jgi:hypothetical protein
VNPTPNNASAIHIRRRLLTGANVSTPRAYGPGPRPPRRQRTHTRAVTTATKAQAACMAWRNGPCVAGHQPVTGTPVGEPETIRRVRRLVRLGGTAVGRSATTTPIRQQARVAESPNIGRGQTRRSQGLRAAAGLPLQITSPATSALPATTWPSSDLPQPSAATNGSSALPRRTRS